MADIKKIDAMWDDSPIDVSAEVNFIWSIVNKLRGSYQSDKYKDVLIPMRDANMAGIYNEVRSFKAHGREPVTAKDTVSSICEAMGTMDGIYSANETDRAAIKKSPCCKEQGNFTSGSLYFFMLMPYYCQPPSMPYSRTFPSRKSLTAPWLLR